MERDKSIDNPMRGFLFELARFGSHRYRCPYCGVKLYASGPPDFARKADAHRKVCPPPHPSIAQ